MVNTSHAIFAFPFAGGTAEAIYTKWQQHLGEDISLYPMELPGHGRLIKHDFIDTMEASATFFINQMKPHLHTHRQYSLLGHSMGSTIAYEVLRQLQLQGLPEPKCLFVSGRNAPQHRYDYQDLHPMTDVEFVAELRKVDGVSEELFANDVLLKLFLPILRNDYKITELYKYKPLIKAVDTQIIGFFSTKDSIVNKNGFARWQELSAKPMMTHHFEGHHFFIESDYAILCEWITQYIAASS